MCVSDLTGPFYFLGASSASQRPIGERRFCLLIDYSWTAADVVSRQSCCCRHHCYWGCVSVVAAATAWVCFLKTAHYCFQTSDWRYSGWMADYLNGGWLVKQSELAGSSNGDAAADTIVASCLMCSCSLANTTISNAAWIAYSAAKCLERDAFEGLKQVCSPQLAFTSHSHWLQLTQYLPWRLQSSLIRIKLIKVLL